MTLVELSFIAIAFIGVFGVIGIAAVVTGRTPKAVTKRLNWKKNLDKKALKVDKSQTNFLAPDEPDFEEENVSEDDEQEEEEIQTDGSIAINESSTKVIRNGPSQESHRTIHHQSMDTSSSNPGL